MGVRQTAVRSNVLCLYKHLWTAVGHIENFAIGREAVTMAQCIPIRLLAT
jgi:hypothetical protein